MYRRGRRLIKSRKPSLELCDGYEGILDLIVGMGSEPSKPMLWMSLTSILVTCIIMVKKRKEGESKRDTQLILGTSDSFSPGRRAASSGGGGP